MRLHERIILGALAGFCFLAPATLVQAAAESGVFVEVRASEEPGAPVVERWRLYGASYALVIGNDNYSNGWPRLSNAVKDAEEVADELRRRGFEVELLTDVTGQKLRDELRWFFAIKGANPDARLFLWYAGHGYTRHGEGYLVPTDAPAPQAPEFLLFALHMRDLGAMARIAKSKHLLAVFDSCFAGTIFQSQRARPPAAITAAVKRPVRQFLTSGDADQQVSDDGTFRKLFLRALRGEEMADANRDGYLTGTELSLYLADRIINLTQGEQTPRGGKLRDPNFDQGDFVFVLPKAPGEQAAAVPTAKPEGTRPAPQATGPSEAALDLEFWNAVKNSGDPGDYRAYLESFPEGYFAPLARARLPDAKAGQTEEEPRATAALQAPTRSDIQVSALSATYAAVKNANLRAGPSTATAVTGRVARGARVTVTGRVRGKNWYRVGLGSGRSAFIYASLIAEIDPRELALWEQATESGNPADYQLYSDRFPRGLFAAEAREREAPEPPEGAPESAMAPPPVPRAPLAEPEIAIRPAAPESPAVPQTTPGAASPAGETQTATLPLDRFDGQWRGQGRNSTSSSRRRCGDGPSITLTIHAGSVSGKLVLVVGGRNVITDTQVVSFAGTVGEDGKFSAHAREFRIDGTLPDRDKPGQGSWNILGIGCKGSFQITRTF